jgi:hypothetical protein
MKVSLVTGVFLKPADPEATMPLKEPERSAQAIRRVLPELTKIDRFERRAAASRERALSLIRAAGIRNYQ